MICCWPRRGKRPNKRKILRRSARVAILRLRRPATATLRQSRHPGGATSSDPAKTRASGRRSAQGLKKRGLPDIGTCPGALSAGEGCRDCVYRIVKSSEADSGDTTPSAVRARAIIW
ncbi:hypothetical protein ADCFC_14390 [Adlercreutzia hattorii]|uniref:Uncharacterized protein n=1 Tax=Adlercreutzia hattorii TaxID=2707299 RepID=A0A6F8SM22_9ACTN|nr:hypothetical protein ADCFC_15600 [Adlercreutzia hattorii]